MVKKLISLALTTVMAISALAVIPYIDNNQAYATTVKAKTTTTVNVRSGAGTKYSKRGTLAKGKTFAVYGVKRDSKGTYWYKMSFRSKTGYVSSKYATRIGYKTSTLTSVKGTIKGNDINVRLGPGTDYIAIARVNKGQSYTVNGKATDKSGKTWYRINYGGIKVYIVTSYVQLPASAPKATPLKAKINKSVNVRLGAGAKNTKIGVLSKGKVVYLSGAFKGSDGIFWYKTTYKSRTAYFSSKYATRIGYKATGMTAAKGTVIGSTDVRLGPGAGYVSIAKTAGGQVLTINGKSIDSSGVTWYRCKYGNLNAYINSSYITFASVTPSSAASQNKVVSASGLTYPTTIAKGKSFTLSGKLSSSKTITKVETGIVNSSGAWVSGYKVTSTPKTTTYDIGSKVDKYIKFGGLGVGTYKYRCVATTSAGTATVFDYSFTVVQMPTVSISGLTYPTTLNQYKSFTLKGKVKSSQPIKSLTLGITDYNGAWVSGYTFTVKPNSTSYDLSKLDSKIKFGNLGTGSYCYKCSITVGAITQTMFSYTFVVNKNTGIPSTLPYSGLTGSKSNDIVKVALSQNGYTTRRENHTAYNLWYYGKDQSAAWCAIFVSWCGSKAGVSTGVIPKMAYVPSITSWYKAKGRFNAKKTLPKKGDLIIYAGSCHIGIVTETVTSTSGKVSTIEGNTGNDQVKYRKNYMKWNSSAIQGYCRPAY